MRASAPGRVNIIGEHIDYNDGYVLPFAIDLRTFVEISPSEEFVFESEGFGKITLERLEKTGKWVDYVIGVFRGFEEMGIDVPPVRVKVWGDLPAGKGLSSSAALEVATAFALSNFLGLDLKGLDIVRVSLKAERDFVGVQCGVMDQYTAVFARKGEALLIDTVNLEHDYIPLNTGSKVFALVDSGVKHELSSGEYNRRREESKEALKVMGKKSFRDVKKGDIDGIHDETLKKRARHVVEEMGRVLKAAEALRGGAHKTLGELLYESHWSLSKLYEVSCEETDFIVDFLQSRGILGARMVGGGFGGGILVFDEREDIERAFDELREEYVKKFKIEPSLLFLRSDGGMRLEF